ncbi:hypothetical protein TRVL_07110 [Trypanosoma vivax]|nr:hypothetical protein TRVL_07110 [Trypanosoma vivax]
MPEEPWSWKGGETSYYCELRSEALLSKLAQRRAAKRRSPCSTAPRRAKRDHQIFREEWPPLKHPAAAEREGKQHRNSSLCTTTLRFCCVDQNTNTSDSLTLHTTSADVARTERPYKQPSE